VCGRIYLGKIPGDIAKRDFVMLGVARSHALSGYDDIIVALIRVDGGRSHARVRVHAGDHEYVRSELRKPGVEVSTKECTVALLHHHWIGGPNIVPPQQYAICLADR